MIQMPVIKPWVMDDQAAGLLRSRAVFLAYTTHSSPERLRAAMGWVRLAADRARAQKKADLARELRAMCYGMGCEYEDRYSGECTVSEPYPRPCRAGEELDTEIFELEEAGAA
jgi:hypothetical protein